MTELTYIISMHLLNTHYGSYGISTFPENLLKKHDGVMEFIESLKKKDHHTYVARVDINENNKILALFGEVAGGDGIYTTEKFIRIGR